MAGKERMEWHQTHGNHVLDVLDTIPLVPAVTTSLSSPIKVLPTSCDTHTPYSVCMAPGNVLFAYIHCLYIWATVDSLCLYIWIQLQSMHLK